MPEGRATGELAANCPPGSTTNCQLPGQRTNRCPRRTHRLKKFLPTVPARSSAQPGTCTATADGRGKRGG